MFTAAQIDRIRTHWAGRQGLLGAPDAEKDVNLWPKWESSVFLPLDRFRDIRLGRSQLVIGRKGSGKSAGRIAAERNARADPVNENGSLAIAASAAQLVDSAIKEFQVREQAGAAAVSVWYKIFAAEFLKGIGAALAGKPLVGQAEVEVRKWAVSEGFAVEDFGERLIEGARRLFPTIRDRTTDPTRKIVLREEHVERLLKGSNCTLFVDDFDNPGDPTARERLGIRNVQAAIEAADLLTSHYAGPNVSLLIREDLWLRCRVGWHYLDKVSMPLWLQWDAKELKEFLRLRLAVAVAIALDEDIAAYHGTGFSHLWNLFFPEFVRLEDGSDSQGVTYVIRRTMYTPRDVQNFLHLALTESKKLPLDADHISRAEEKFSTDRMQYLVNEFGTMCEGLSQCLHSFAGHSLEWRTSDLRKHLNGQLGQGAIRPSEAACANPKSAVDLMRFLFRIGFLEVRIPHDPEDKDGPYEVRDGLRHPDHWSGARADDSVKWAVRSTFYQALQSYRADHRSSIGSGRKRI